MGDEDVSRNIVDHVRGASTDNVVLEKHKKWLRRARKSSSYHHTIKGAETTKKFHHVHV